MQTTTTLPRTPADHTPPPNRPRPLLLVLIALAGIAVLLAGFLVGATRGGSGAQPSSAAGVAEQSPGIGNPAGDPTAPATPGPAADAAPAASPGAVQPEPEPAAPQPEQPAPEPPAPPAPDPGVLSVDPTELNLSTNVFSGSVTVHNTGGETLTWFAVGLPGGLEVTPANGTLDPGEEQEITVDVDSSALDPGSFEMSFHLSANDTATEIVVSGAKQQILLPDPWIAPVPEKKPIVPPGLELCLLPDPADC